MSQYPPRIVAIAWLLLLGLLGSTVFLAYRPLGNFNLLVALIIASAKALIVAAIFMELRKERGLVIAFASAGFFWLAILIWLSGTDFTTREQFPPSLGQ